MLRENSRCPDPKPRLPDRSVRVPPGAPDFSPIAGRLHGLAHPLPLGGPTSNRAGRF